MELLVYFLVGLFYKGLDRCFKQGEGPGSIPGALRKWLVIPILTLFVLVNIRADIQFETKVALKVSMEACMDKPITVEVRRGSPSLP